jgi:hypothetical protein
VPLQPVPDNYVPTPDDARTIRFPGNMQHGESMVVALLSWRYPCVTDTLYRISQNPDRHPQRRLLPCLKALVGVAQCLPVVANDAIRCTVCDGKPQYATITGAFEYGYSMSLGELYCHFDKDPKTRWRTSRHGSFRCTLPLKLDALCMKPLTGGGERRADWRWQFWNDILRHTLGIPERYDPEAANAAEIAWEFLAPHYERLYGQTQKEVTHPTVVQATRIPQVLPRSASLVPPPRRSRRRPPSSKRPKQGVQGVLPFGV